VGSSSVRTLGSHDGLAARMRSRSGSVGFADMIRRATESWAQANGGEAGARRHGAGNQTLEMSRPTRNVAGLVAGIAVLIGTAVLARRPRSQTETHVFRLANGLPDRAYSAIWVPMQYGTFATVPVAAAVALAGRRPRLALAIGAGGTAAWVLAKAVKPIVDRGRPSSLVEGVVQRGAEKGDRGFPSGHAAVSAVLTVVAWPYLSDGRRGQAVALSAFVPFARMYVGAHLPLDLVGGSALGFAIGCAFNLAFPVEG
jgi:membrane-associated phospholipid phosphatase